MLKLGLEKGKRMPSQDQWDNLFLKMALEVSKMSKDESTKVGSIMVTSDNTNISFGYNGMVSGILEPIELWSDRPSKLLEVIHSEENTLLNSPFRPNGCTIYITHQPCTKCIIRLSQAKIKRVVYINEYPRLENRDVWEKYAKKIGCVIQKNII
jgi:dCMP deaminase